MGRAWGAVGEAERVRAWLPRIREGREGSLEVAEFEIGLDLRDRDFAGARRVLAEVKPAEGSRAERVWWEAEAQLCILGGDLDCAEAALARAEALVVEERADGRDLIGSRLDIALFRAVLAHKRGSDAGAFAREETVSEPPAGDQFGDRSIIVAARCWSSGKACGAPRASSPAWARRTPRRMCCWGTPMRHS